jgi:hypothetical protein
LPFSERDVRRNVHRDVQGDISGVVVAGADVERGGVAGGVLWDWSGEGGGEEEGEWDDQGGVQFLQLVRNEGVIEDSEWFSLAAIDPGNEGKTEQK